MRTQNRKSALPDEPLQARDIWQVGDYRCRFRRWAELERDLNRLLALLLQKPGRFLVVSQRGRDRYIQFAVQKDGGIAAEAVSNKFLDRPEAAKAERGQYRELLKKAQALVAELQLARKVGGTRATIRLHNGVCHLETETKRGLADCASKRLPGGSAVVS
jgi:hypothetical protein